MIKTSLKDYQNGQKTIHIEWQKALNNKFLAPWWMLQQYLMFEDFFKTAVDKSLCGLLPMDIWDKYLPLQIGRVFVFVIMQSLDTV